MSSNLEKLKSLRDKVNWENEQERGEFFRQLDFFISKSKGQLSNLGDIFQAKEIDWLLLQAVKKIENHREQGFVKFVIGTGYKDKPDVDEDGKPSPHRTTAVHQIARCRPLNLAMVVRQLFKLYNRFDVNYTDEFGLTHLHVACMAGCLEVVRKFLEFGQDPNCLEQETGDSPLHLALAHKRIEVAKLLLKNGANPNLANQNKLTPLHIICKSDRDNYCDLVKMLFELCDDKYRPVRVNARDKLGNTPLLWALFRGRRDLFELLLWNGANPNVPNADGLTPLQFICQSIYCNPVLIETFFDINDELRETLQVDSQDSRGRTPLHEALANSGNTQIIRALMKRGANPNLADAQGSTPLHVICKRRYSDHYVLAKRFFELGEENDQPVQIDRQDELGRTPLHLALLYNYVKMAELLLRRGANPNLADSEGLTVLHVICQKKSKHDWIEKFFDIIDDVRQLVQIDAQDKLGQTPLNYALASRCSERIFKLLLRRGSDPNVANADGSTLLHWICDRYCDNGLAEIFFEINNDKNHWVYVDAEDNLGQTPLQLAVKNLLPRTVDVLLNHGADLSSFVFPTVSHVGPTVGPEDREYCKSKLRLAARAVGIVECFHNRGYELDQSVALLIMKYFAEHELFLMSSDLEKRLYDDEDFASRAKEILIKPDLSLFDLVQLRPDQAQKLLIYTDYYKLTNSTNWCNFPVGPKKACEIHLCEKLSRGFFRRWTVYPFWKLTHYRLPLECCDMIVKHLMNEDSFRICLVATGMSE